MFANLYVKKEHNSIDTHHRCLAGRYKLYVLSNPLFMPRFTMPILFQHEHKDAAVVQYKEVALEVRLYVLSGMFLRSASVQEPGVNLSENRNGSY